MTGIAALVGTFVMSPVAADVTPLSCIPAGVTRSAGFRLDLDTNTFARPIIHPNAAETGPTDINNGGDVVGTYVDGSGQHGFVILGGTLTTRDDIIAAYGINDRREVVGIF